MNLDRLRSALTTGGEHLGDLIFWTLTDARIDRATLESYWKAAGLDTGLLPDEPTAERALKIAVREAQVGQRDRLIRLGCDDEEQVVFAVVHEQRDADGNVAYTQEARVRLDRKTEGLGADVDHSIAASILAHYQVLRTTHTADDVRRAMEDPCLSGSSWPGQPLSRLNGHVDDVVVRRERADPAAVVTARRVVHKVQVDDERLAGRAEIGALGRVEQVPASAVTGGAGRRVPQR